MLSFYSHYELLLLQVHDQPSADIQQWTKASGGQRPIHHQVSPVCLSFKSLSAYGGKVATCFPFSPLPPFPDLCIVLGRNEDSSLVLDCGTTNMKQVVLGISLKTELSVYFLELFSLLVKYPLHKCHHCSFEEESKWARQNITWAGAQLLSSTRFG